VPTGSTGVFQVVANYNGVIVNSGATSTSGTLDIDKDQITVTTVAVTITAVNTVELSVIIRCPLSEFMSIVNICLTSNPEAGFFVHNEYRYTSGTFTGPLQQTLVSFGSSIGGTVVSEYQVLTGLPGTGGFPPPGSLMNMASHKFGFDTFNFNPANDKFMFFRSNTLYANTPEDIAELISEASVVEGVTGSDGYYSGDFSVPSVGEYLYMIWDYRQSLPLTLCYSEENEADACCNCGG
jgi:hypothetical protein